MPSSLWSLGPSARTSSASSTCTLDAHDLHEFHDPHPGNFILSPDNDIVVLDFGCIKRCDARFADGILDIIDACWQDDYERVARLYRKLGFGGDSAPDSISHRIF